MAESIIVHLLQPAAAAQLDGRTFQIHVLNDDGALKLYPVEVVADRRCPVLVGGERCGRDAGHEGKHAWQGGD